MIADLLHNELCNDWTAEQCIQKVFILTHCVMSNSTISIKLTTGRSNQGVDTSEMVGRMFCGKSSDTHVNMVF